MLFFHPKQVVRHCNPLLACGLLASLFWQTNAHAAYCKYTYELSAINSGTEIPLERLAGAALADGRTLPTSREPASLAAEMRIKECLQQGLCEKELSRLGSLSQASYIQTQLENACDALIKKNLTHQNLIYTNKAQTSFSLRSSAKITLGGSRYKRSSGKWQNSQDHCLQGATLFAKEIIHTCKLKTPPVPEPHAAETLAPKTLAPESDCAKQFALFQQDSAHAKHPICRLVEAKPACYRSYIIPELGGESAFRNACLNRYALCQRAYITQYDHDICALVKARKNCEQDFVYATDRNNKYDTELIDQFESTCQTLSTKVAEEEIAKEEEPVEEGVGEEEIIEEEVIEEEVIEEEVIEEEVIEEVVETKTIPQPTLCYASISTLVRMNLKGMQVCENNNFQACQEVVKQKEDKLTLESKQNLNFDKLVGHYVCDDALENCQFAVEESSIGPIIYEFPACPEEEPTEEIVEEIDEVIQEIIPEPGLICYASIPTLERMDVEGMLLCNDNNYTDCLQVMNVEPDSIFLGRDWDRLDIENLAGKHLCDANIEECILITEGDKVPAFNDEKENKEKENNKNNKSKNNQSFAAEALPACDEEVQRLEEIEEQREEEIAEEVLEETMPEPDSICSAATATLERINLEGLFVCSSNDFTNCLEVMDVEPGRIFLGRKWQNMDTEALVGKYLCDEAIEDCILVANEHNIPSSVNNSGRSQNGPHISVRTLSLSEGEILRVQFSHAPDGSWIGAYPEGQARNCRSFSYGSRHQNWTFTNGSSGQVALNNLSKGKYEVRLFDSSDCFIGDPAMVSIIGQGESEELTEVQILQNTPVCEEELQRQEELEEELRRQEELEEARQQAEEQAQDPKLCHMTEETINSLTIFGAPTHDSCPLPIIYTPQNQLIKVSRETPCPPGYVEIQPITKRLW